MRAPGDGPETAAEDDEHYVLVLFVSGTTPNSVLAIDNTKRMCDAHLRGRHRLTIVDLYQQPELAQLEQIIAAPTLIRKHPMPVRRLIGTMVDATRILLPTHQPPRTA